MATSHGLSDDERGPARERHDVGHAATRVFRGCARAVHRLYPVPNFKPVRSRAPRSSLGAPRGSQFHLSVKQCCDTPSREQTYYSNSCFDRDRGTDCPPARAGGGVSFARPVAALRRGSDWAGGPHPRGERERERERREGKRFRRPSPPPPPIPNSPRDDGSNLVDPASSHTLVSKIKPCMSKYKRKRNCEWLIISVIVYLIVLLYG